MTEHFAGAPRRDQISSAEMNSACGKVLLRKTLAVEQKQQGSRWMGELIPPPGL